MNINVHIERLILDGLPMGSAQGASVQAALETELARLLAADGSRPTAWAGGAMPSVSAGDIQLRRSTDPVELGQQIAGAVYGSFDQKKLRGESKNQ